MSKTARKQGKTPRRAKSFKGPQARESLLKAATSIFALKGLRGTSIRDIAQAAGLNSSMISYYFGSKEQLYKECVTQIGEAKLEGIKSILTPANSKTEYTVKLKLFAENLLNLFLEEREAGLIIIREFDRTHSPAGEAFRDYFLNVFDLLLHFLEDSQKKKYLNKKLDPYFLTSVFFGTLTQQMRMDHIVENKYKKTLKDDSYRSQFEDQLIEVFL